LGCDKGVKRDRDASFEGDLLRSSIPLYDALAKEYEHGFYDVPHRKAYDQLAWERVSCLLPGRPGLIVDAGCGTGHWVDRLLPAGHRVIGIEQAPGMIDELRRKHYADSFQLIEGSMEEATIASASADLVLAMGSLQYSEDPASMLHRFASWTKPGGTVAVLTDSYVALVLELLHVGKKEEALERLRTRRGMFRYRGEEAELHLLDRRTLESYFAASGLQQIVSFGLLVTASALGMPACTQRLLEDETGLMQLERNLGAIPALADNGKQLLVVGRKPK
jgi:SAM-dependent methyltransferase